MHLDIRTPIGLLFTAIGLVLCVYGLVSNPAVYNKSFNINVNLIWGAVLVVFGLFMLCMVCLKVKKVPQVPQADSAAKKSQPAVK